MAKETSWHLAEMVPEEDDEFLIILPGRWQGLATPDLNTQRRFLRGGTMEDMLLLEEDQVMSWVSQAK